MRFGAWGLEVEPDDIASAYYGGGRGGSTVLLQQGCPVPIHYPQIVPNATSASVFNVECREFERDAMSLLNFYHFCPPYVVWIASRVVRRSYNTLDFGPIFLESHRTGRKSTESIEDADEAKEA